MRTRGHFRFTFDAGPLVVMDDAVEDLVASLLQGEQEARELLRRP